MKIENASLWAVLTKYKDTLNECGAASGKVIIGGTEDDLRYLDNIDEVKPHPDLYTYFRFINGYDQEICDELDLYEPEFAWQMYPIAAKDIADVYDLAGYTHDENPDYWPEGFLPILKDDGCSYVVVNCNADSPTYGAVYEMRHCVGSNMISKSLEAFILGNMLELQAKLRTFEDPELSEVTDLDTYFIRCQDIYGNTPFFSRDRADDQIVDWK